VKVLKDRAQVHRLLDLVVIILRVIALGVDGLSEEAGDGVITHLLRNLQAKRRLDAREGGDRLLFMFVLRRHLTQFRM
jgi:hypothetical protein